jgi:protein-disulfide isomerase
LKLPCFGYENSYLDDFVYYSDGLELFVFSCSGCMYASYESTKQTITNYVQKKYKLPMNAPLSITEATPIEKTCYQRLQIRSADSKQPFSATLHLSPDQHFLSSNLLDVHTDPLEEERKQQEMFRNNLNKATAPARGPAQAPVTLVAFSDFQCPYCKGAADLLEHNVLPAEGSNVRLVFRHFPLSFHTWAQMAAEAAACAQHQSNEAFWLFHDYLFAHQPELTIANLNSKLAEYAQALPHFDIARYKECVSHHQSLPDVQEDIDFALNNKISGTPTVFINGRPMEWAGAAEQVRTLIRQAQRKQENFAASK